MYHSRIKGGTTFEPSINVLLRLLQIIDGTKSKTELAVATKTHYGRLKNHIRWLEKRGLVESIIADNKIVCRLTPKGKQFAAIF